jgi:hypothetical protein
MNEKLREIRLLKNEALIERVANLADRERFATADLVLHLAELKRREAYRELGFASLWSYLRERLGMSEAGAGRRIKAAKIVLLAPKAYELLREKKVSLSILELLSEVATKENVENLLSLAEGKSMREIRFLVGALKPQPLEKDRLEPIVVKLTEGSEEVMREMVKLFAIISREVCERLEALKVQLSSKYPTGAMITQLLTELLDRWDDVERQREERLFRRDRKREEVGAPLPSSETSYIPKAVERAVSERDECRCSYVSRDGNRCSEVWALKKDHVIPLARGGQGTVTNTRLLCRAHNRLVAEQLFGKEFMGRKIEEAKSARIHSDAEEGESAPGS